MKKLILLAVTCVGVAAQASEKRMPVSVTQFVDKSEQSARCGFEWDFWHERLGSAFREMLINELAKDDRIEVLERETISQIYQDEHNLINSERHAKDLKKGGFKKARLTLAGSVSEFELCAEQAGGGLDLGFIASLAGLPNPVGSVKIEKGGAKAKAVIDVRTIDVETGVIISTVTREGESEDKHFSVSSEVVGTHNERASPIAKAAREAIRKASDEIRPLLVSRI